MMKRFAIISTYILFTFCSYGQYQGETFELNQQISNGEQIYEASKSILLQSGFDVKPVQSTDCFLGKISPFLLFPPTTGITGGPITDDDGVVGSLSGQFVVNEMGAAVYTIPIQLPQGVGPMTPSIALTYSSMGGNGLLGWGWGLSGSSSITRSGTTIYHDGFVDGVDFDDNDKLSLDGTRLIAVSANENEYHTEIESFSKIEVKERNQYGPLWIEVRTKDGRIMEYGRTDDSKQIPQGKESILSWHLNRIKDLKGNYIDFQYNKVNNHFQLNTISYGGNETTGQTAIYKISFIYTSGRKDIVKQYMAGSEFLTENILTNIDIIHCQSNRRYLMYELNYDWSDFYTRLRDIKLYDEHNHLNPTRIYWGDSGSGTFEKITANEDPNGDPKDQFFLDINGDGRTDVIKIDYFLDQENQSYAAKKSLRWYYRLRTGNNTFGVKRLFPAGVEPSEYFCNLLVADFNGDGRDDFLDLRYDNIRKEKYIINRIFFSNGTSFNVYSNETIEAPLSNSPEFLIGDFDGNGKQELMTIFKNKNVNEDNVFIKTFSEQVPNSTDVFWERLDCGNIEYENARMIVADFNGDGKSDLLKTVQYGGSPNVSNCGIYAVDIPSDHLIPMYVEGYPTTWHKLFPGDFNGDGITDLLTYNYTDSNPQWEIGLFDGSSFHLMENVPQLGDFDLNISTDAYSNALILSDFNADGKTDILKLQKESEDTTANYNLYYSNGNGFPVLSNGTITSYAGFSTSVFYHQMQYDYIKPNVDFNGDGFVDFYFYQGVWGDIIYLHDPDNAYFLIQSITDGLDNTSSVVYSTLTNDNTYTKGNSCTFPLVDIQPPLKVVTSIKQQVGDSLMEAMSYRYEGLKLHKQGKGMLGFSRQVITNLFTENITITDYDLLISQDKYFFAYPKKAKTYKNNLSQLLSENNNSISFKPNQAYPLIFFPYIDTSFTNEYDYISLDHKKCGKVIIEYDNLGNIVHRQELAHPLPMLSGAPSIDFDYQIDVNTTFNVPDIPNWILGQTNTSITTTRYKTESPITKGTRYVYYLANESDYPLVKEIYELPDNNINDSLAIMMSYDYDSYGNTISSTQSAPNYLPVLPSKTITTQYSGDYQHRYPTSESDPLNYSTSSTYDPIYGNTLSNTDINNLETNYSEDLLGIDSKSVLPNGVTRQKVLRWASGHPDAPRNAMYYSWQQVSGQTDVITFYHKTGVELRTVAKSFDGKKIYTDKSYNEKGQLFTESLPYDPEAPIINNTTFVYDGIGRVASVYQPDGTVQTTNYNGNEIITSITNGSEAQSNSKKYNVVGWVDESKDNMGKIVKYEYRSDGNLKSAGIVGQNSTVIEIDYNSRGQKKHLNDPNYGIETYIYNAYNELVEQVSPKADTTKYTYDILGRTGTITNPEGEIQYIYNTNPGRLGTLNKICSTELNHSIEYSYDNLLRVVTETEKINSDVYVSKYGYDKLGRNTTTGYPSGLQTVNYYNSQGYLTTICTIDNKLLWKTNKVNNSGQVTEFTVGNGLKTNRVYNPQTSRLESVITCKDTQTPIQDAEYGWDDMGNMNFRKKWTNRSLFAFLTESFNYDDQNRLTEIWLNDILLGNHNYDSNGLGNIILKQSDGNLVFNQAIYGNLAGPHAITSAQIAEGSFPQAIQSILYTSFDKVSNITEGTKSLSINYGLSQERISQTYEAPGVSNHKVFTASCEYITKNGAQSIITYLSGPEGIYALHVIHPDGSTEVNYIHTDHLGSWNTITDQNGNLLQELSFDVWGNRRDPLTWRAFAGTPPEPLYDRGFTGHEHLYAFNLINMNGRMYDPVISRMLSPDNYVQFPDYSQNFNRYSYCLNNPLKYTDPSGEIIFTTLAIVTGQWWALPIAIGADVGMWKGGAMANGTANPLKWDYSSGKTWGYMVGGATVGGISGYIGGEVAMSGIPFANTLGIASSSLINSAGMNIVSGGETDMSIGFGFGNYNFATGEFGYLGKKGNSLLEDIVYSLGAVANISDIYNYATWDVLSYQEKINKLQKMYKDECMIYDQSRAGEGTYDENEAMIIFGRKGLNKGLRWARSTYEHEALHRSDYLNQPSVPENITDSDQYNDFLDTRAYRLELQHSAINRLNYNRYMELYSRYVDCSNRIGIGVTPVQNFTLGQWISSWLF